MSRNNIKVDEVRDRDTGHCITVYLNRDSGEFHAEFNGNHWKAATKDVVMVAARKSLETARALDWKPVIGVTTGGRDSYSGSEDNTVRRHEASLGLSFFRCEAAKRPGNEGNKRSGGDWIIRPFLMSDGTCDLDLAEDETIETLDDFRRGQFEGSKKGRLEDRKKNKDWFVPWWGHSDSPTLIPYSEEKWAALVSIKETVVQTQQKMDKLLEADHIDKSLIAIHGRLTALLGSGEKPSKKELLSIAVRVPVKPEDWNGRRVRLKYHMRTKGGDDFQPGEVLVCEGVSRDGKLSLKSVGREKGRKGSAMGRRAVAISNVDIEDVEFVA